MRRQAATILLCSLSFWGIAVGQISVPKTEVRHASATPSTLTSASLAPAVSNPSATATDDSWFSSEPSGLILPSLPAKQFEQASVFEPERSALSLEESLPVSTTGSEWTDHDGRISPDSVPPMPNTGFWFVNTHQSNQTFRQTGPCFRPGVCRYEKGYGYRQAGFEEMLQNIQPGLPVCIMIHGSFVDTVSASRESIRTWQWLNSASCGRGMQMIYVHWPSFRSLSPLVQIDTNQLGRRAARNGFYVADIVNLLPPECPVCLVGHSHGCRVISSALHLLAGGSVQRRHHQTARVNGRRIRTVFCAAAIDHDWLNPGQPYDRALLSTEGILNLKNYADPALAIYPLRFPLIARRPIGNVGMTRLDRRRIGPLSAKVRDIDVGDAVGNSHLWPYYFNNRGLARLMSNYVFFPDHASSQMSASN